MSRLICSVSICGLCCFNCLMSAAASPVDSCAESKEYPNLHNKSDCFCVDIDCFSPKMCRLCRLCSENMYFRYMKISNFAFLKNVYFAYTTYTTYTIYYYSSSRSASRSAAVLTRKPLKTLPAPLRFGLWNPLSSILS